MDNQVIGLLITLAMLSPILIPLLMSLFWVNLVSLRLLRQERRTSGPATLRKGSRKLFVIYPSNKD